MNVPKTDGLYTLLTRMTVYLNSLFIPTFQPPKQANGATLLHSLGLLSVDVDLFP